MYDLNMRKFYIKSNKHKQTEGLTLHSRYSNPSYMWNKRQLSGSGSYHGLCPELFINNLFIYRFTITHGPTVEISYSISREFPITISNFLI